MVRTTFRMQGVPSDCLGLAQLCLGTCGQQCQLPLARGDASTHSGAESACGESVHMHTTTSHSTSIVYLSSSDSRESSRYLLGLFRG